MMGPEGHGIAKWLNKHGITGIVLRYRLPKGRSRVPLYDAQRALRTIRANAAKWRCDPKKVGIIGFSAGGHLASTAATHFDQGNPKSSDPIAQQSSRPDFCILIYPVITMGEQTHRGSKRNLLGASPSATLSRSFSSELQVNKDTPPTFLAHAKDDRVVPIVHSELFHKACNAHGVNSLLLRLPSGGHGLNGYQGSSWDAWQSGAIKWLRELKLTN